VAGHIADRMLATIKPRRRVPARLPTRGGGCNGTPPLSSETCQLKP
jgi:hypothetical protein